MSLIISNRNPRDACFIFLFGGFFILTYLLLQFILVLKMEPLGVAREPLCGDSPRRGRLFFRRI